MIYSTISYKHSCISHCSLFYIFPEQNNYSTESEYKFYRLPTALAAKLYLSREVLARTCVYLTPKVIRQTRTLASRNVLRNFKVAYKIAPCK